jgi:hypothetical protein
MKNAKISNHASSTFRVVSATTIPDATERATITIKRSISRIRDSAVVIRLVLSCHSVLLIPGHQSIHSCPMSDGPVCRRIRPRDPSLSICADQIGERQLGIPSFVAGSGPLRLGHSHPSTIHRPQYAATGLAGQFGIRSLNAVSRNGMGCRCPPDYWVSSSLTRSSVVASSSNSTDPSACTTHAPP